MSFVDSLKKGLFGSEDDYDDQYMDDGPQMVNNNSGLGVAGDGEEDEPEESAAPKRNGKASKIVELNATLTLRQGNDERTVIVKAITEQRRPASEAALLYEETAESVEKREKMALARKLNALTMPHPDRRPDKKERRDLLRFKHGDSE